MCKTSILKNQKRVVKESKEDLTEWGEKYIQRSEGCILKMQILQKLLSRSKQSQSKSSEFLGGEGTHLENNSKYLWKSSHPRYMAILKKKTRIFKLRS